MQPKTPAYSPHVDQQFPNRVLWGVAHVHTGFSFDSGMFGVTLTPDDLFRVSSGGEVVLDNGQRYKQDRPLDWVSITDHAEYLGIADQIRNGSPELLENPQGRRWYEMSQKGPEEGVKAAIEAVVSMQTGTPVFKSDKLAGAAWTQATKAAEQWNRPGVFTTLHGFEWTSAPGGNNLHRTVIFRDDAKRVNQVLPFSAFDSSDPAQLWKYMDAYEKKTGGQVLAIPHNGNLSNGMMYSAETFDGKPMDRAYAETRASHEPCSRPRRSRATARRPPTCHRTTNSPISSGGTSTSARWRGPGRRAPCQLRALGAEARARVGSQARREPVPRRHDWRQRRPRGRGHDAGRQLLRRVRQRLAVAGTMEDAACDGEGRQAHGLRLE